MEGNKDKDPGGHEEESVLHKLRSGNTISDNFLHLTTSGADLRERQFNTNI